MSLPHTFFATRSQDTGGALGYFGPEYGGWIGDYINISESTGSSEYTGSTSDVPDALDYAVDWSTSTLYGSYNSVSLYPNYATASSGIYNGNPSFYTYSGTRTDLSGHAGSGITTSGRGACIAYLSDASRTPVFVAGHSGDLASQGIYIYRLSNGAYLGKLAIQTSFPSFTPSDLAGLAWDGTHVVAISRTKFNATTGVAHRILLPASTAISGNANVTQEVEIPHAVFYGAAWGGNVSETIGYLYLTDIDTSTSSSQIEINWGASTSQLVGARGRYSLSTSNYSLSLDTKNRRLVLGGYSNRIRRSFGE